MVEKNRIVLNDGTEIENGSISESFNKQILIIIPGKDIVQATLMLSDKQKTKKMIYYNGIFKTTYINYTAIGSIGVRGDKNEVHIYMIGEDTSIIQEYTVPDEYLPKELRKKEDHEDE